MNIQLFFLYTLFLYSYANCQTINIEYTNKGNKKIELVAHTSLQSALKINPDSVVALDLTSQGLYDFPEEILRFKNLMYLNIDSYSWEQALDSLTESEKQLYYELKAQVCDKCGVMRYFRPSTINYIPRKIKHLKKLEYISFGEGVYLHNKRKFKRIYRYLPNTLIFPNKYDL
jgi:hypothetical protein